MMTARTWKRSIAPHLLDLYITHLDSQNALVGIFDILPFHRFLDVNISTCDDATLASVAMTVNN